MEETKKKRWNWTVFLCVVLLGLNLWQLRQLSDLREQLRSTETNLQTEIRRLDERLVSVQRMAKDADKLVEDWNYNTAVLPETRSLAAEVSVTLKEWRADTAAELVWAAETGQKGSAALTDDGSGSFTGTIELSLWDFPQEISLDVKITSGETTRRENLGYLGGFDEMLPVQSDSWSYGGPEYTRDAGKNGTLTLNNCGIRLEGLKGDSLPDLSGQVFRLRRNGEIAMEKTAMLGETFGQYTCWDLSSQAQIGDKLALTFFCRDGSGLGYEFFLNGWTIDEHGLADAAPEADWPKLTWD